MKITKSIIYFIVLVVVGFMAVNYVSNITKSRENIEENSNMKSINVATSTKNYNGFNFYNLNLIISDTEEKRTRGLSDHLVLLKDEAMFFVFPRLNKWGIWMKEMKFSIDIIWFDENFKIVALKKDAKSESYPEIFYPEVPAKYVIETNSGFINDKKLFIGQKVFVD